MFNRASWLLILCVICICSAGGIFFSVFRIYDKDRETFHQLEESAAAQKEESLNYSQAKRSEVCKEAWIHQDEQELHCRIFSKQSSLFLIHEKNRLEAVEQMTLVNCLMQEELYYLLPDGRELPFKEGIKQQSGLMPMQLVRHFVAERASYHYNTHLFIADNATLYRFRLPGHELVSSIEGLQPIMSGSAKNIQFTLSEKNCNFTAHQFKANFDMGTVQ